MSPRRKTKTQDARVAEALRVNGYRDGLRGRPPKLRDPVYMASYRRGNERRREMDDES